MDYRAFFHIYHARGNVGRAAERSDGADDYAVRTRALAEFFCAGNIHIRVCLKSVFRHNFIHLFALHDGNVAGFDQLVDEQVSHNGNVFLKIRIIAVKIEYGDRLRGKRKRKEGRTAPPQKLIFSCV